MGAGNQLCPLKQALDAGPNMRLDVGNELFAEGRVADEHTGFTRPDPGILRLRDNAVEFWVMSRSLLK